jgi:hypothetical protein
MADPGQRHGAAIGGTQSLAKSQSVLKLVLRIMAGRARHRAITAQRRIEEQCFAQAGCIGIIGVKVAFAGGSRAEPGKL